MARALFSMLVVALVAATSTGLAAQEQQARDAGDPLIPSCNFTGALCGYVDRDGNTIIAPRYDWADRFYDDRAMVRLAGRYGFIDRSGNVLVPPIHQLVGSFLNGHAEVLVDGKIGLIDASGRWTVTPQYGRIIPLRHDKFLVGVSPYRSLVAPGAERLERGGVSSTLRGRLGLLDASGRWVVAPTWPEIQFFTRTDSDLVWVQTNRKWQLMRADGQAMTEAVFDHVQVLLEDRAVVHVANKWGAVDGQGQIAIPLTLEYLSYFNEGMALFRADAKTGLLDRDGHVLVPPKFERLGRFDGKDQTDATIDGVKVSVDRSGIIVARLDECPDGRRIAPRDGKMQIVGLNGRPINDTLFDWIRLSCDAPAIVQFGTQYGLVDASGRLMFGRYFERIHGYDNGIAAIVSDGKWGIVDETGAYILQPMVIAPGAIGVYGLGTLRLDPDGERILLDKAKIAELARNPAPLTEPRDGRKVCADGVIARLRDGKWGFTDRTGVYFLPPRYDQVGCFNRGIAMVAIPERREWCTIDKRGDITTVRPCECNPLVMIIEHPRPNTGLPPSMRPPAGMDCYAAGLAGYPKQ
jgi:hypothetical protein